MKKIKYLIFLLGISVLGIINVDAASISVYANKTTVVVGNSVSVTVSVSGDDADAWEYTLDYDKSKYTLTSHSTTWVVGSIMGGNKSVTFTFKSRSSGSSTFSLKNASVLDYQSKEVLKSKGTVTVRAKTQAEIEASYSTNANLSNLKVEGYSISPSFNKDTLEYTLEVENNVEKVNIKATKADYSASVRGVGEKELTEGINRFEIVVTAEKGNKKTYVLEINRKELNPIHVSVNGESLTIVRKADALEAPSYYASTEVEIEGEEIPAFKSEITGYTLVGLKDESGTINLYRYDNAEYILYKQVSSEGFTFIPEVINNKVKDYEILKNIKINDVDVDVYTKSNNSDFVLIYGMNASTGEKGWYKYDSKEGTFQRYVEEVKEVKKEELDMYFIVAMAFAALSGVTILLVIVLLSMNSKLRKKNNKLIKMLETKKEEVTKVTLFEKEKKEEKKVEKEEPVKEDTAELSQRELRRKEKEKEHQQHEELRKMQEDFLKTEANEIIEDDVELEENTPVTKSKRGRKKKN